MTTVDGISAQGTNAIQAEESEVLNAIDIKIANTARPSICAAFDELQIQDRIIHSK